MALFDDNEENENSDFSPPPAKSSAGKPKAGTQKALPYAPALKLESANTDPFLAKIIILTYVSLIDIKKIDYKNIAVEENRQGTTFLYFIENRAAKLSGYIGRNKDDNSIIFVAVDQRRFHWAKQEGFITDELDTVQRALVFNKIGVLINLDGIKSFINFISGDPSYIFEGDYILA